MKVYKILLEVAFITYNKFAYVSLDGKPCHGVHDTRKIRNGRVNFASCMLKETYSMLNSLLINGFFIDTICNGKFLNEYFKNVPTIQDTCILRKYVQNIYNRLIRGMV